MVLDEVDQRTCLLPSVIFPHTGCNLTGPVQCTWAPIRMQAIPTNITYLLVAATRCFDRNITHLPVASRKAYGYTTVEVQRLSVVAWWNGWLPRAPRNPVPCIQVVPLWLKVYDATSLNIIRSETSKYAMCRISEHSWMGLINALYL